MYKSWEADKNICPSHSEPKELASPYAMGDTFKLTGNSLFDTTTLETEMLFKGTRLIIVPNGKKVFKQKGQSAAKPLQRIEK